MGDKKGVPDKPVPPHGTRQRYIHRVKPCHCEQCQQANADYIRWYRERRKKKNA